MNTSLMNTSFRMFLDSDAAKAGDKKPQTTADEIAMQQLLGGVHF